MEAGTGLLRIVVAPVQGFTYLKGHSHKSITCLKVHTDSGGFQNC